MAATKTAASKQSLTQDMIENASKNFYYIQVKDDGSHDRAQIGGAAQRFKGDRDFIYLPALRLCGKRNKVIDALRSTGTDDVTITAYLQETYTADNAENTKKKALEDEIKATRAAKASKVAPKAEEDRPTLAEAIDAYKVDSGKTGMVKETAQELSNRIKVASDKGKVLDVTNEEHPRAIAATTKNKIIINGLAMTASATEPGLRSYLNAVSKLGPEFARYGLQFQDEYNRSKAPKQTPVTPVSAVTPASGAGAVVPPMPVGSGLIPAAIPR